MLQLCAGVKSQVHESAPQICDTFLKRTNQLEGKGGHDDINSRMLLQTMTTDVAAPSGPPALANELRPLIVSP
jgi:hypothetical protein